MPPCLSKWDMLNRVKCSLGYWSLSEKGGLFQTESYPPRISRRSPSNWHTFYHACIGLWCRIFLRKHDKSSLKSRQNRFVLMADVLIVTSQCRCTWVLSKSYIMMHHNTVTRDLSVSHILRCIRSLAMKAISRPTPDMSWGLISKQKRLKSTHGGRPSITNRITDLLTKV